MPGRGAKGAVVRAEADGASAVLVIRVPVDQADALVGVDVWQQYDTVGRAWPVVYGGVVTFRAAPS